MFHADLHVHSRFSRACSKDCDPRSLAWWAARKGITVIGTGDFTHPAWAAELKECLVAAEPGLWRLRPELESDLHRTLAPTCHSPVRFLLSTEISTIYATAEGTRKVHHLVYAPTFEAAGAISEALAKVGNLASDGRPILGLDSRHLLEITLNAGPGCFLVPAHIWTPWFAVLGSKSGFDTVADCYRDLASHVFAVETGLSSDPPMNWLCSSLDGYRLVANSDAHSPPMIGREATTFSTELDYFAMAGALRTGTGLAGTINFFPEGGRYHLDGHRKCGIRLEPSQTITYNGICPECGKPLTIGVLHRVTELADRAAGHRPPDAAGFANLVSLPEIVAEIRGCGPKTKQVTAEVDRLVGALGPELHILCGADVAAVSQAGGSLLGEAITRLRRGTAIKDAGYDGEYGTIRLFQRDELTSAGALFELPEAPRPQQDTYIPATQPSSRSDADTTEQPPPPGSPPAIPAGPVLRGPWGSGVSPGKHSGGSYHGKRQTGVPADGPAGSPERSPGSLTVAGAMGSGVSPGKHSGGSLPRANTAHPPTLDSSERPPPAGSAPAIPAGPAAGGAGGSLPRADTALDPEQRAAAEAPAPLMIIAGPGTGKTRTLTHRIAAQVTQRGASPRECLALTFTRRAAAEMRERLAALIPEFAALVTVTTFHGLGLAILREHAAAAGLAPEFEVADDQARLAVAAELAGSGTAARRLIRQAASDPARRADLVKALIARNLVDFDCLVELPLALLRAQDSLAAALRERWRWISVDEFQDIDPDQYELLRLLSDGNGLTVIGDPDQAIYGFRGAGEGVFARFAADHPGAGTVALTRNYRSTPVIVTAAMAAIAPSTLVPGRVLTAAGEGQVPGTSHRPPRRVTTCEAAGEQAEAAWIAGKIEALLGGSSFHSLDTGRADGNDGGRLALSDIAILYRTDAQSGPLGQALTRAGLPFQKRTHDLLARRTCVPEIIREMSLADTGIGTGTGDGQAVTGRLAAAVAALARRAGKRGPALTDTLAAGEVLTPLARRCGSDLERFLTEIALGAEADTLDPRADAISLLTLHAAKGLEFPVVFLAGCERGLLPLWLPGGADGDPAEERRLLFVGMTRARTQLLLTWAARRNRRGKTTDAGSSPFLAAIGPALLDAIAAPASRPAPPRQLRLL